MLCVVLVFCSLLVLLPSAMLSVELGEKLQLLLPTDCMKWINEQNILISFSALLFFRTVADQWKHQSAAEVPLLSANDTCVCMNAHR